MCNFFKRTFHHPPRGRAATGPDRGQAGPLVCMAKVRHSHPLLFCVLVFMRHENDPCPFIAQGRWDGGILERSEGEFGFGYDPVFGVASHHCSAAQLSLEVKNSLSHRGKALALLKHALFETSVV